MTPKRIDERYSETRAFLRVVGPLLVVVGLIFTILGVASFFSSFGSFEPPKQFWCAFVGLPLLGVGSWICKFAFLGTVSRYVAGEVAPVGKDVVNYLAEGAKGAVRDVAAAVGEGLRSGGSVAESPAVRCRECNAENDASARFCKACGASIPKAKTCEECGEANDPDARFCDNCGEKLSSGTDREAGRQDR